MIKRMNLTEYNKRRLFPRPNRTKGSGLSRREYQSRWEQADRIYKQEIKACM